MHITQQNQMDEIKKLISEGVDVNARFDDGQTPIHLAAKNGDVFSHIIKYQ